MRSQPSIALPGPDSPEFAPALACAVLILAVVAQLAIPSGTVLPEDSALAPRRVRPPQVAAIPDYPAILQAPLFAPDRTPRADSGAATGGDGDFSLMGVAAGRRFAVALVKGPDGKVHSVSPGGEVMGWRLAGLDRAGATLVRGSERMVLALGASTPIPQADQEAAQ